ncbi:MAG: 7-cyano-7-deazaguanine synthase [Candidatus Omnitrophica bacterium ADurb.Bin277]|nr:MAG: 7-cyano-7-deazaguanine synthase [Candidatus Omnitrophica bacterium ADurb.Bin277]
MKKAVCLLSGGMDSAVTLYFAKRDGFEPVALSFDYGQRHEKEVAAAARIAEGLKVPHSVVRIRLPWRGSALLDEAAKLPHGRNAERMSKTIPSTYVPARNSVFLALAFSCAEAEKAEAVFFGANALDYSGYPDCRPDFIAAFAEAMRQGTKTGTEGKPIRIMAPLLHMTKKEIVQLGKELGVPFADTWTCYEGGGRPCGTCDACVLRAKGFYEAGIEDPLVGHAGLF